MRSRTGRLVVLADAIVVLAPSCGDDQAARTSTTTAASTTSSSATATTSQLDAMLLDASDVGAEWGVPSPVNAEDLADATRIPCPDVAVNPTIAGRLTPVTGVQFEPAERAYRHLVEFAMSGDAVRLDADLRAFFGAVESCSTATPSAPGALKVETLPISTRGDQRAAFVLVGRESPDAPATWYVRDAVVRVGGIAIELGLAEILPAGQDAPHFSDADFDALLGKAVAKLERGSPDALSSGRSAP